MWKIGLTNYFTSVKYVKGLFIIKIIIIQKRIMAKPRIKIAIAGVGNCASALVQGIYYYKDVKDDDELVPGLMHNIVGNYKISDIEIVAAFDIDKRKVGKDLSQAIFAKPNCTKTFCHDVPKQE